MFRYINANHASLFIGLLATFSLFFATPLAAHEHPGDYHGPIRVGIFPFEPMNFVDQQGQAAGFNPSLLREIARQEGWEELVFVEGSWAQGLQRLQHDEIDLMMSVAYNSERAKVMDYTRESALELWGQVFVVPDMKGVNISDLAGQFVGVMRRDISGRNFIKTAKNLGVEFEVREFPGFAEVFAAVQRGEVIAGVAPQHFGLRHADEYNLIPSTIQFSPFSIYFTSKKGDHLDILRIIDTYLFRWKQQKDSFYYQQLNKWLGLGVEEKLPGWFLPVIGLGGGVILFTFVLIVLFKGQVRKATAGLEKANQQLQESQEKYRFLYVNAQAGLVRIRIDDGKILECNQQVADLLGYPSREDCMADCLITNHYANPKNRTEFVQSIVNSEQAGTMEAEFRRCDGSRIWLRVVSRAYPEQDYIESVAIDITELKRSQQKLIESEQRFRTLFDQAGDAIFLLDETGRFCSVNQQAVKILGYSAEEMLTMKVSDISIGKSPAEFDQLILQILREKERMNLEGIHRRKDGSLMNVDVSAVPLQLQSKNYLMAIARDITVQKKGEECLLFVSQQGWSGEEDFLRQLVKFIGTILEKKFALLTLLTDNGALGKTNGLCVAGELVDDIEYALAGTPCEQVVGREQCLYNGDVQQLFPEDAMLVDMGVKAYAGIPLWDTQGNPLGLLAVMHTEPFKNPELIQTVLQIVSVRVAHEIEKQRHLSEIEKYQQRLEQLVEARTAQLEAAKNRAEAANQAKSAFLSNMSHELRTPLTSILGYSHLMQRDVDLPERIRSKVDTINRSGNYLRELINEVLEVSRIEAGHIELNPSTINLKQFFADVQEIFSLKAKEKGLELKIEPAAEMPARIRCDEGKLKQAIINLIGNAVKFTDQGFVFVSAAILSAAEGVSLSIYVKDSGPGIDTEDLEKLFQPFEQGRTGRTKGGTGLGLVLSREYARLMGGDLSVSSATGGGSNFVFSCSVELVDDGDERLLTEQPVIVGLRAQESSKTVLVVDDVEDTRRFVAQLLNLQGLATIEAKDGREALRLVASHQPDLIIMDMRMDVMDGYQAIRALKYEQKSNIPIIAASASAFEADRLEIMDTGANAFIRKPFDAHEIFREVGQLLELEAIYKNKDEKIPLQKLTAEAIGTLPAELRQSLEVALVRLNVKLICDLLEGIRHENEEVGEVLEQLAGEYRYDAMLELLREAESSRGEQS